MERLVDTALEALTTPQHQRHDALLVELRESPDDRCQQLALCIDLRRAVTLGHVDHARELVPQVDAFSTNLRILPWLTTNVRGILSDDDLDAAQALVWFEKSADQAAEVGLVREERISRQNLIRTATRYGRRELITTAGTHLGQVGHLDSGAHEALGEVFENLGDWDAALWHYGSSEKLLDSAVPLLGRARVYIASGESARATQILAQLEPVAPDDIRTRSNAYVLAALASLETDLDHSRELALDSLKLAEKYGYWFDAPDARLTLAECDIRSGDIDGGLERLEGVASSQMLLRDQMRYLDVRGRALWIAGRHKEALVEHAALRRMWDDLDEMRSVLWETYRALVGANQTAAHIAKLGPINAELHAASEGMQVAAARAGHDLRSGLGVIKLAMSVPLEQPMRDIALSAISQMNDIVEQVQWANIVDDAQRLETRLGNDAHEVFDLVEVVRSSVSQFSPQVARKRQVLKLDADEGEFQVNGHRVLAVQIVNNLTENAMHYTEKGGDIEVSITSDDEHVILEVADSGVGVPEGEEEQIFRAFVRLRQPTSGEASTGLGLYIVRSSVDRLNGSVSVHRREDGPGSIFRVMLPKVD